MLGLSAAGGGLLAACGNDEAGGSGGPTGGSGGSGGGPSPAGGATTTPAGGSAPASGPGKRGGTLTVATGGAKGSDTLDPMLLNSVPTSFMSRSLYSQLVDFDNQLQPHMKLAESVESNKAGDEWTIRLREDAEFHHGKTVDADDVIFTWQRTFELPGAVTVGKFKGLVDLNNITKMDDRTLRLKLLKPNATFVATIASPFKIIPVDFDPKNPVGSGPFKYKSFTANRQWVLERFENWWDADSEEQPSDRPAPSSLGPRPYVDELIVNVINDDSARVNALVTGQVDAVNLVPYPQIPILDGTDGLAVVDCPTGAWTGIYMNMDIAPFDDVRVRQALRLVIDRDQALTSCLSGHGTIANDLPEPFDAAYPKDLVRERDIEKAKQLLKEAGKENLEIELVAGPVSVEAVPLCTVMANNAAEAGITINVKQVDTATLFGPQFHHWAFSVDKWPAQGDYLTLTALTDLSNEPLTHLNGDVEEKLRALYSDAVGTTDESKRNEIKRDMYQLQYDEGAWIIPFFANAINGSSTSVAGWPNIDANGRTFGNGHFDQVYRVD